MAIDQDDYSSLFPSASPIASMGIDPDEILASGDPQGYMAAKRAGVPYQPTTGRNAASMPTAGDQSALAAAVGSGTPPSAIAPSSSPAPAAGTATEQPTAPSIARDDTSYSLPSFGENLAQASVPATNAPNPPAETDNTGAPTVPATVTPTGVPDKPAAPATPGTSFSELARNSLSAATTQAQKAAALADSTSRLNPTTIEGARVAAASPQSAQNPNGTPNFRDPNHPEYRPSAGRRIIRGLVGAGEGLARGGIRGALLGSLDPNAVGATAYGAPTKQFSQAAQMAAGRLASLDQQLTQADTEAKTGDEATKTRLQIAAQFSGIGKDAAANLTAQNKSGMLDATLAKAGMKAVRDEHGNLQEIQDDPDSEVYKSRQVMDDLRTAKQEQAEADAALKEAQNNPDSPAYKLAVAKNKTATANAAAAQERAAAYMGNYLQHSKNVDLQGNVLPGAPIISDEAGAPTVVGSTNANTAIKNQSNVAQFNDVHGALDDLEGKAKALVQKGGSLNSPAIAAALAQPAGTLGKWLQGAGVKANLSPEERAYVQSIASAHENIQALRKSAGGTATDSAVEKLDAMIPGASTPDLNYLLGQTGQIRSTAERLGKGATTASGGLTVHKGGAGNAAPQRPSGVPAAAVWNGEAKQWQLPKTPQR